jgi:GrpB-like predicted nucleotidyltransferase (UPF0157 family)
VRLDPIVIVAYDPAWVASFEAERELVQSALGDLLTRPVEHIGSTAVPGLAAKPIIDMLAVVEHIDDVAERVDALRSVGWVDAPESTDAFDRSRSFCTPSIAARTHHLHVVEDASENWRGWVAFRDHLRTHPEVAREYASLKQQLAAQYGADPNDRNAYRGGKAGFIARVTELAQGSNGRS